MRRHNSTPSALVEKPAKPDGSPLYPNNGGKWAKYVF